MVLPEQRRYISIVVTGDISFYQGTVFHLLWHFIQETIEVVKLPICFEM